MYIFEKFDFTVIFYPLLRIRIPGFLDLWIRDPVKNEDADPRSGISSTLDPG
jgi:hypothetical protein